MLIMVSHIMIKQCTETNFRDRHGSQPTILARSVDSILIRGECLGGIFWIIKIKNLFIFCQIYKHQEDVKVYIQKMRNNNRQRYYD